MVITVLFATTNVIIIAAWAVQLTEESKETRIRRLKEEAEWWKNACAVLEEEKEFLMKVHATNTLALNSS